MLYSFSGGMLDQSAWTTMGWIGWAMAWGTGLPDGVCGRALWGLLLLRSGAVGFCGPPGSYELVALRQLSKDPKIWAAKKSREQGLTRTAECCVPL